MKLNLKRIGPPKQAGKYKCIVIDPPWQQKKGSAHSTERPNNTGVLAYDTLPVKEIAKLPISDWAAPVSFIWLWVTNSKVKLESQTRKVPILQVGFDLLEHWGFNYYTLVTWYKGTGPIPFGPYQIVTEHSIFGYRGKWNVKKLPMGTLKTMFTPTRFKGLDHSQKPPEFYQEIVRVFPGPRLDVFARKPHEGFDGWGDQYNEQEVADIKRIKQTQLL